MQALRSGFAGLALAICLTATGVFAAEQPVSGAAASGASVWAQAQSDLTPDPAVRFGVLPNGMRYALMRNDTPATATSIRLRIGSGSLEESDDEQGLAHVLEHMAFRGSKNVPAGEMIKILERDGLAFGPDTNAATGWTETVYMLDLPHTTAPVLQTGLMLMRETAGNLLLDPKALETERGVVLSEERLRDTPNYRAQIAQIDLFLHGQLAAKRVPIGKVEVIKTAPASLVRAFYDANYRPDRATLIVVGDIDPAAVEGQIKTLFGSWTPQGAATAAPDLGKVEQRGLTVREVRVPGASTDSVIGWARPYDGAPDTEAKEIRETIENLGLAVLNRRLSRLAQSDHPPFLSASASFENLFASAKIAVVEATSQPANWQAAMTAADREVRQLVAFGVSRDELDREITEMRSGLQSAAVGAATRPTPTLADELVRTVDENEVFTPPSEDLKVFDDAVKGLTPERVNAALKDIFSGSGPLVELASPDPVPGGEATVRQVFEAAAAAPLTAPAAQSAVVWPYTHFGPTGVVTSRREVADLGVTQVTFANGVKLNVKPTDFRKDQILVSVDVGEGRLGLPADHRAAIWSTGALIAGGFGKISYEDSQRALAGKLAGVVFGMGDNAFAFKGATRPQDLDTALQLVGAYLTDPGYRTDAFERLRAGYLAQLPQIEATPGGVFQRDSGSLWTRNDPRFGFPTREELQNAKPGDLKALVGEALAHGRLEVTLVGDVTVDQAIALTADTLGTLPRRETTPPDAARAAPVQFPDPTPEPITLYDTGRADQAVAVVSWPLTDFYADMQASRAIMLAGEVLQDRLVEKVRVAQGATYSPESEADLSQVFPGYGVAFAEVEMPPALIPGFFDAVKSITQEMADKGVTADDATRARNPRIAGLRRAQLTNEYWLTDLDGSQGDPRRLDLIRTTFTDYEKVTPADIQAAAKQWFRADKAWELEVRAKPDGTGK
jgi:zinc protease